MKKTVAISILCLLTSNLSTSGEDGFQPMFNGKDLAGWTNVNTAPSTWKVQDSLLICSGKPIGEIRTERMYQNFIMELEWRHMKPKGNAGVFVWADDVTAQGQPFHRGIEVQVLENAYGKSNWFTTHGDIFPIHGAKMKPINGRGGSRAFPTEERSKPSPDWNHYRIECIDGNISLAVNGKVVTRGTDCSPRKGYICLESEGGIVHYRNVRIKVLPDSPIQPEHVAIANRGYKTIYTGVDLSGWKTLGGKDLWKSSDWVLRYTGKDDGSTLESTAKYADVGFIFDVKRANNSSVTVEIAGTLIEVQSEPGKWQRYEGTIRNGVASILMQGQKQPVSLKTVGKSGPVRIRANMPTDFANLFVRKI